MGWAARGNQEKDTASLRGDGMFRIMMMIHIFFSLLLPFLVHPYLPASSFVRLCRWRGGIFGRSLALGLEGKEARGALYRNRLL